MDAPQRFGSFAYSQTYERLNAPSLSVSVNGMQDWEENDGSFLEMDNLRVNPATPYEPFRESTPLPRPHEDSNGRQPHSRTPASETRPGNNIQRGQYQFYDEWQAAPKVKRRKCGACRDKWDRLLDDTWFLEIMSWSIAIGCLVGILIILGLYDGKLLASWPLPITLNAMVQTLLTIARLALTFPVSQGLSQLMWLWYTDRKRPALDCTKFDGASRGIIGSLKLLGSVKSFIYSEAATNLKFLPILGAVIAIFAIAVAPVSQQAVQTVLVSTPIESNTMALSPTSNYYYASQVGALGYTTYVNPLDQELEAAIYTSLLTRTNKTYPPLAPHCSTGDCHWSPYQTLGICAATADISDLLKVVCVDNAIGDNHCNVSLPNGVWYSYEVNLNWMLYLQTTGQPYSPYGELLVDDPSIRSIAFEAGQDNSLTDFFMMYQGGGKDDRYRAFEVNLHYCVQTLETKVVDGTPSTNVTKEYAEFSIPGKPKATPETAWTFNWTAISPGPGSDRFEVSPVLWMALRYAFSNLFNGNYTVDEHGAGYSSQDFNNIGIRAAYHAVTNPPYDYEGVKNMARNVATGLTNNVRSYADTRMYVAGTAMGERTYVHVVWPWLTLLYVLIAFSSLFLALVIHANRHVRNDLWKSSPLAFLCALDVARRPDGFRGLMDNRHLQQTAEEETMRLRFENGRWNLKTE